MTGAHGPCCLCALVVLVLGNMLPFVPDARAHAAGRVVDAAGYLLVLAAALTMIVRRGTRDLGGVIDTAVIAFAAGSLLWAVLPHRLGPAYGLAAQLNLFVVVFALTGVVGVLLRLVHTTPQPVALWLLTSAITLAIGGNIVLAVGGDHRVPAAAAVMMFMAAFTATGLFGLDPAGTA